MTQTNQTSIAKIEQIFTELERLNPDSLSLSRPAILKAASALPESYFDICAGRVARVVEIFAESTFKKNQHLVMDEYFQAIRDTTARLAAKGEDDDAADQGEDTLGDRLLPVRIESPSRWLTILSQAGIDEKIHRAMDACANRNEAVDTPLEIAFQILFSVNAGRAFSWCLEQLGERPVFEDAEVIRDMFAVWNCQKEIDPAVGKTALELSEKRLEQFFPGTALQVNRLVRFLGLKAVHATTPTRSRNWEHLGSILSKGSGAVTEGKLEVWLDGAVEQLGKHTASFIACAERIDNQDTDGSVRDVSRRQLFTDVRAVNALHPAIIAGADILLKRADGAHVLALAFLGIDRNHLRKWRSKLEEKAAILVRTLFLQDLRNREDSAETIRKFCLGDELLYIALYMKLDLMSRQFGSIEDREKAVGVLAANYASFREVDLLKEKITTHYRRLAKLLHADSLQRLLPPEETEQIDRLRNLSVALTRASESRRYLEGRRALENSVEDMCAAEVHFEEQLNTARTSLLRGLIG